MSSWMLAGAGVLYLITAIDLAAKQNYWMSLAFVAYAIANVGFIGATS